VPHPCVLCKGGYDAADTTVGFLCPYRLRSRWWFPPFANYAKDGAPTVLVNSMKSKAWATRHYYSVTPFLEVCWLCLHRRLRLKDAVEAFAVLEEDEHPQRAGHQRRSDAGWCKRQMESKDVIELCRE